MGDDEVPKVEERLASLEARIDAIGELRTLILDLRGDMIHRFEQVENRFQGLDRKIDRHLLRRAGVR